MGQEKHGFKIIKFTTYLYSSLRIGELIMHDVLILISSIIIAGILGYCMISAAIDMVKWGKKSTDLK